MSTLQKLCCILILLVLAIPPAFARDTAVVLNLTNADRRFDSFLKPYMVELRQKIQRCWLPSATKPPLNVCICFAVTPDGQLEGANITRSSGNSAFDESASDALQKAVPFGRPPQPGGLRIVATFDNRYIDPNEVSALQTGTQIPSGTGKSKATHPNVAKACNMLKSAGTGTLHAVGRTLAAFAPVPNYGYSYGQWTPQYPTAATPYSYPPGYTYQQPSPYYVPPNSLPYRRSYVTPPLQQNPAPSALEQAVALDKQARKLVAMNRPDDALALYDRASKLDPNPASHIIHLSSGLLRQKQGDLDGALDEYKRALSFKPDMAEATANIASCFQQMGELPLAISWLSKYLQENPTADDTDEARKQLTALQAADKSWAKSDPEAPDYFDVIVAQGKYRWPKNMIPLKVFVQSDPTVDGFRPSLTKMVTDCFDKWADASGHRIDWEEVKDKNAADVLFRWRRDHEGDQLSGAEGGLTIDDRYTYEDGRHTIERALITVWTHNMDGTRVRSDEELRATTLHEIGHALGLPHSPNNNDVMFFSETSTRSPVLTARDKATLIRLYTEDSGTPPTSPSPPVSTSNVQSASATSQEIDFAPYMRALRPTIINAWYPPQGTENSTVVVVFKIHRRGELSHLRLEYSSGSNFADQAALTAVENAAPFPPLPIGSPEEVDIQFTFDHEKFLEKRHR